MPAASRTLRAEWWPVVVSSTSTESTPTSTAPAVDERVGAGLGQVRVHRVAVAVGAPVAVPPGPHRNR